MVRGVGTDLVEVSRFASILERRGQAFVDRVFTETEQDDAGDGPLRVQRLAARWAAKEAAVKAVGRGLSAGKWTEIELVRDDSGAPLLLLHGQHACAAAELGIETLHVSISHTQAFATAVVVAEG